MTPHPSRGEHCEQANGEMSGTKHVTDFLDHVAADYRTLPSPKPHRPETMARNFRSRLDG